MVTSPPDVAVPAGWTSRTVRGRQVLVEDPGAGSPAPGDPGNLVVVAAEPVAVLHDGGPVLSLVVVLERQPPPDSPSVVPLIVSSTLSMDVAIGVEDEVLAELDTESAAHHQRLYADEVTYRFGRPIGIVPAPPLAEGSAQGTIGRAALSASLDRADTLSVMGALRGTESPLLVQAVVTYSRPAPVQLLRLRSTWAEIWDAVAANADNGVVTTDTIRLAVVDLIADDRLDVDVDTGDPPGPDGAVEVDPEAVARAIGLQAGVVLDRSDPEAWRLRARPHPAVPFAFESRLAGRVSFSIPLSVPLHRLLGGPLAGQPLDRYVSLVAPRPTGELQPVAPRRTRRNALSDRDGGAHPVLARNGELLTSVSAFAEPRRVSNASAVFLASEAIRPAARPQLTHLPVDDIAVSDQIDRPEHLPVIDDGSAPAWADRIDGGLRWYAPHAELVLPTRSAPAAGGPFSFRFRRTGITDDSRPALEATISLTLRRIQPAGADAAAAGARLAEVHLAGVAVALEVPFVDGNDGTTKTHILDGVVTPTDTGWTVHIRVVNDWVRICYRALSGADPAAEPGAVRLDYSVTGYTPVRRGNWEVALRPSAAVLPVHFTHRTMGPVEPSFDARTLTLRTRAATVSFRREEVAVNVAARNGEQATGRARPHAAMLRPIAGGVVAERPVVVHRPLVRPIDSYLQVDEITYAKRTFVRRVSVPARVPCAAYGNCYLETTPGGDVPAGCRDELQLGETRYAIFRELVDLGGPEHRVHQILQQPGRFLVEPLRFGITRHGADEGRLAFRPCVVLYAVLDPDQAANNRVQLDATLQPAIGRDRWAELTARLHDLDPTPQLLHPTEVEGVTATFHWAVPGTAASATTTVLAGGLLRVGISCSIPDWLLIRTQLRQSSLSGGAEFRYPDGTTLRSELVMDLTQVLGPWDTGPVLVTLNDNRATLTNRTERTVDVGGLLCTGDDQRTHVPVGVSLPSSGTTQVPVPTGITDAVPAVSLPRTDPVDIEESRSFVDAVETNVVFVNLVALADRGLARLTVTARVQGLAEERTADVTDDAPTAELRFVLSLTGYLTVRTLEYRITVTAADGTTTTGDWSNWDLAGQGNVISLTWGQLGTATTHDEGEQPT